MVAGPIRCCLGSIGSRTLIFLGYYLLLPLGLFCFSFFNGIEVLI